MTVKIKLLIVLGATALTATLAACSSTTSGKPSASTQASTPTSTPSSVTSSLSSTAAPSSTASATTPSPAPTAAKIGNLAKVPGPGPFRISQSGNPNTWPNACTLINIAEVRALDPQVTGLSGAPVGTKATVIGGSGGNSKNNTQCKFNLHTSFDPKDGSPPSYVAVNLQSIGPDAASTWKQEHQTYKANAAKFPDQFIDFPNLPGGTNGFWDGTEVQALHTTGSDAYNFWIAGNKAITTGSYVQAQKNWAHEIEAPLAAKLGSELK